MKKNVLFLGASGLIGPYLTPGLDPHYNLRLADIAPHPDGKDLIPCDVTDYDQVLEAARGMDAIMNFTVNRNHPDLSFHVNTRGAYNVLNAAAELGIKKIIHSGPQYVRRTYDHDFDIADVPPAAGTGHYVLTKLLARELCRTYARAHNMQIISFVFNGLGPAPTEPVIGKDYPPFTIVWEDLQQACRLALEIPSVPDNFQEFNMLSYQAHGKYTTEKAHRILGYQPSQTWEKYFTRPLD